jgi:hypothetical protein
MSSINNIRASEWEQEYAHLYPGYEIDNFESEGGNCTYNCKEEVPNAGKEERHEKHQESEAVRKAQEHRIQEV